MALVIDLVRALREPEYRDEVSEELEGDITDYVGLEAAEEIERLRSINAELVEALDDTLFALSAVRVQMSTWNINPAVNAEGIESAGRVTLSRARAKEDT